MCCNTVPGVTSCLFCFVQILGMFPHKNGNRAACLKQGCAAVHVNFTELFIKVQTHKSAAPHVATHIINTITIFHHLCWAPESTDKPRLHYYYFQSDRQTNIFCNSDFHLICHNTLRVGKNSLKTGRELLLEFILNPGLSFNPPPPQNTLHTIKLRRDPALKCGA